MARAVVSLIHLLCKGKKMNSKLSFMVASVMFLIAMPALAEWDFAQPHVQVCNLSSSVEVNTCLGAREGEVDKRLNAVYQQLKNMTSGDDTSLLVAAQRAWLKFREKECKFFNPKEFNFNTHYQFEQMRCDIDMAEKRIKDIERYLDKSGCGSCRW